MVTNQSADSVVADMERIFEPLAGRLRNADLPDAAESRLRKKPAAGGWKPLTLAAPALVLLVGAALAIGYARQDNHAAPPTPATTALPIPRMPTQPVAVPVFVPSPGASVAVAPTPLPSTAIADETRRHFTDAGVSSNQTARLRERALGDSLRRPINLMPRSTLASRHSPVPAGQSPEIADTVAPARQEEAARMPYCPRGSLDDRCIYQDVLNADERLRLAYDHAQQSGVASSRLASINRRWRQARKHALDDPDGTIRSYDQLANTLAQGHQDGIEQ